MSAVLDRSRLLVLEISGSTFSKGDAQKANLDGDLRPTAVIREDSLKVSRISWAVIYSPNPELRYRRWPWRNHHNEYMFVVVGKGKRLLRGQRMLRSSRRNLSKAWNEFSWHSKRSMYNRDSPSSRSAITWRSQILSKIVQPLAILFTSRV